MVWIKPEYARSSCWCNEKHAPRLARPSEIASILILDTKLESGRNSRCSEEIWVFAHDIEETGVTIGKFCTIRTAHVPFFFVGQKIESFRRRRIWHRCRKELDGWGELSAMISPV